MIDHYQINIKWIGYDLQWYDPLMKELKNGLFKSVKMELICRELRGRK